MEAMKRAYNGTPSLRAEQMEPAEGQEPQMKIRGYPILFNTPAKIGDWTEIIRPASLDGADLEGMLLLGFHKDFVLLGKKGVNLRVEVDEKGLFFEATLPKTRQAEDIFVLVRDGILDGMSFAFMAAEWRDDPDTKTTEIRKFSRISEISLTPFPAYEETVVVVSPAEAIEIPFPMIY